MEEREAWDWQEATNRIEALVEAIERVPDPAARESARALAQAILDLHGAGLARILEIAGSLTQTGAALPQALAEDALTGSLLLLHGLHPADLRSRVEEALTQVRPYLHGHGGDVELLEVSPAGEVSLRLQGSCHGCPSSRQTLQHAIEKAIYEAAPDVTGLDVQGVAPASDHPDAFIPISQVMEWDDPVPLASDETNSR